MLSAQGKYQEAIEYFDRAMRIKPSYRALIGKEKATNMLSLPSPLQHKQTHDLVLRSEQLVGKYQEAYEMLEETRTETADDYREAQEVARALDRSRY